MADQLGHADPALTLRVCAHAMRDEEHDLSFAEFGGSKRLYPAPTPESDNGESPDPAESMARREGFARSLRSLSESTTAEPAWARSGYAMRRAHGGTLRGLIRQVLNRISHMKRGF